MRDLVCRAPDSPTCDKWREDLARWQTLPPEDQDTVAAGCRSYYPKALAEERDRPA